jgi:hypothetical protein
MPHFLGKIAGDEKAGICALFYGDTNSGKTHAAITAPKRILHINKEPKDPRLVHSLVRNDYADLVDYVEFSDFDDEQDFLNQLIEKYVAGERPYETIFNDSLTFAMANTKTALERMRFDNKETKAEIEKKAAPTLIDYASVEQKDWGTLASLTARNVKLLHRLSKFGLLVVSTAIATEYPKWNNTIKVAPSLLGQEFPKMIHGFFDTIGYVKQPFYLGPDGTKLAPRVSFVSHSNEFSNTYMVRANPRLIEAERKFGPIVLDLTVISKIIRGEIQF